MDPITERHARPDSDRPTRPAPAETERVLDELDDDTPTAPAPPGERVRVKVPRPGQLPRFDAPDEG